MNLLASRPSQPVRERRLVGFGWDGTRHSLGFHPTPTLSGMDVGIPTCSAKF
jgi:hypothetical protein